MRNKSNLLLENENLKMKIKLEKIKNRKLVMENDTDIFEKMKKAIDFHWGFDIESDDGEVSYVLELEDLHRMVKHLSKLLNIDIKTNTTEINDITKKITDKYSYEVTDKNDDYLYIVDVDDENLRNIINDITNSLNL